MTMQISREAMDVLRALTRNPRILQSDLQMEISTVLDRCTVTDDPPVVVEPGTEVQPVELATNFVRWHGADGRRVTVFGTEQQFGEALHAQRFPSSTMLNLYRIAAASAEGVQGVAQTSGDKFTPEALFDSESQWNIERQRREKIMFAAVESLMAHTQCAGASFDEGGLKIEVSLSTTKETAQ